MMHPASFLKNSWHAYGHNFRGWLLIALPFAVLTAIAWAMLGAFSSVGIFMAFDRLPAAASTAIVMAIAAVLVVAGRICLNAAIFAAASANAGHMISFRTAYGRGLRLCWPVLWVAVLRALIVFAGLLLLVIPGIIWASRYSLAVQTAVLEEKRGLAAFRRSRELTSGKLIEAMIDYGVVSLVLGYATWIFLIVVMFVVLVLGMLINSIPGISQTAVFYGFQTLSALCEISIVTLALPFAPLLATAIYKDFNENR